jgi:hypothetical protein
MKYHQYQIVGRHLPTEAMPEPPVYRMKLCVPHRALAGSRARLRCSAAQLARTASQRCGYSSACRLTSCD